VNFIGRLSELQSLAQSWATTLSAAHGVYLLTCPRTKEQYVGSATGQQGFWQRWLDYCRSGHGGNVALKSRDPSDYQVAILEVAGSSATDAEILQMESRWKQKFQSQEMGLNRN
jgi:GIY-YIG catalytic domain